MQLRIGQIIDVGETIRMPCNKTKNNVPIEVPLLPVARDGIAKQGTDLLMLKELGGWERIESVQRYSHIDTDA